jgi:hypothetical protein
MFILISFGREASLRLRAYPQIKKRSATVDFGGIQGSPQTGPLLSLPFFPSCKSCQYSVL